MKIAVKIAFMAAATIPAAASAQEAGRMLSLDEAVAVTLTENPALKAAAYEERAAQQQRRAAIGLRNWPSPRRSSPCVSRWWTACAGISKTPGRSNATA